MKQPKTANYERLTELHERHLSRPPTSEQYDKAFRLYVGAVAERDRAETETARNVHKQKTLANRKRLLLERHRKFRIKMAEELERMAAMVGETHDALRRSGEDAKRARARVDEAAEGLVLVHGSAPIDIGDATHDFGCYGSRIYLVPRKAKKRKR